ncbi:MAG: hypothetical protein MH204_08125 [Fimbriimonadaceae bacterium]|nr:hypothetical protein [Fimbriimonadaceae bacterium]
MALSYRMREEAVGRVLASDSRFQGRWIEDLWEDSVILAGPEGLSRHSVVFDQAGTAVLGNEEAVPRETSSLAEFSGPGLTKRGMIFRIGWYPDKGFGLTREEADRLVSNFRPVPLNFQHEPTVLDRKDPGRLEKVWRQGDEIWGEVRLSKWMADLFAGEKIPVSCGFGGGKTLDHLAVVWNPRIEGAAVFQSAMVGPEMDKTTQIAPEEVGFVRKLKAFFTGEGAAPDPVEARFSALESRLDKIAGSLEALAAPPAPPKAPEGDPKALAAAFADRMISEGRATPAERDQIILGHAALAGHEAPQKAFEAAFSTRPAHELTRPVIKGGGTEFKTEEDGSLAVTIDVKSVIGGVIAGAGK